MGIKFCSLSLISVIKSKSWLLEQEGHEGDEGGDEGKTETGGEVRRKKEEGREVRRMK